VSAHDLAIDVLVAAGVAGELLCCLGLVLMRNLFDRLHYVMASTTVPPFLIAAAVVVEEDWTQPAVNALLIAAVLFVANPVLATATARAARARRFGRVDARPEDRRR
jgi:monovalent cation/proton antiporter MnhG/PhaG subunit